MAERNWYDDVIGFFGQDAQSVISGRQEDPVTGKVKAGLGDFFAGRSQAELDAAYDQMKTTQRRKKGRTALEESGYTATELGLNPEATSVGAVRSAVRKFEDERSREKVNQAATDAYYRPEAVRDRKVADRRYYDDKKERAQLRLDTLQAAQRAERREDKRYNERMELEMRKDRRAAMQNLAAGLASLGAAFAL